jgi:Ca-activated chloride channel homolog
VSWFLIILLSNFAAADLRSIPPNNEGVEELKKENGFGAYRHFVKALEVDSFNPFLHMNLGLAFSRNKEPEKAEQEYRLADRLAQGHPDIQFMARFNLATALTELKNIPGALEAYQSALEIRPDSQEVKTNIELLWQGQSGGQGESQSDDKEKKDGDGKDGEQNKPKPDQGASPPEPKKEPKNQPKPFSSEDLTPETVRKILEELKAQEERVRADQYSKGAKERPRGKDW